MPLPFADPAASTFLRQLLSELTKVSGFYVEQAQLLEVRPHQQAWHCMPLWAAAAKQRFTLQCCLCCCSLFTLPFTPGAPLVCNIVPQVLCCAVLSALVQQAGLAQQTSCSSPDAQQLSELRAQIRQLIKFVALNYLAVVKAIKKRNRHCKVGGAGRLQHTLAAISVCLPAGRLGCPQRSHHACCPAIEHSP